ncbi:MAG: hypothetical protein JWL84_14 [Rhodospirillales bacterium]|nr:hypothetical protein [Rhodospirillales bacterium]
MSEGQEKPRRLRILVENTAGLPMVGARIKVFYRGEAAGEVVSSGRSLVEFDDIEALELTAAVGGLRASAQVTAGQDEVRLVIPTERAIELAAIPTARCPDGSSGQPCVTCRIGGRNIRICA